MHTKDDIEFIEWWRELNAELNKLHPGQQAGLSDARGHYDARETPQVAALSLFDLWTEPPGRKPKGELKR